jgi:hypothetical protein
MPWPEPVHDTWNECLDWLERAFVGRQKRPSIRLTNDPLDDRSCIHVVLGGSHPGSVSGAMLGDHLSLDAIRDIVTFASNRQLPVEAWVLWGLGRVPRRLEVLARWVASLARVASRTSIVVRTDAFDASTRRRLQALLVRTGCEVVDPREPAEAV